MNALLEMCAGAKAWIAELEKTMLVGPVVVHTADIVVCKTNRSIPIVNRGVSYYDGVAIYYHGQSRKREWLWRDGENQYNDAPYLAIHGIGKIIVREVGDRTEVTVELVNNQYHNWEAFFVFAAPKVGPAEKSGN